MPGMMVSHDQPFSYSCECYKVIVIYTGYLGILGHRDYGGLLDTCWYYRQMGRG
jgi:hypothetical protein